MSRSGRFSVLKLLEDYVNREEEIPWWIDVNVLPFLPISRQDRRRDQYYSVVTVVHQKPHKKLFAISTLLSFRKAFGKRFVSLHSNQPLEATSVLWMNSRHLLMYAFVELC